MFVMIESTYPGSAVHHCALLVLHGVRDTQGN
jgi:hypothetical protein